MRRAEEEKRLCGIHGGLDEGNVTGSDSAVTFA